MNFQLLDFRYKKWGILITFLSIVYLIIHLYFGIEIPIFNNITLYSILPFKNESGELQFTYKTNIIYKLVFILFTMGLYITTLSKQKNESIIIQQKRLSAFVFSIKVYALLIIISNLFIWEFWLLYVIILTPWLFMILYKCFFIFNLKSTLISYKFFLSGWLLIFISMLLFVLKSKYAIEIVYLKNITILNALPHINENGTFQFISKTNFNYSFISILFTLGLVFISICKQKYENNKMDEIRFNSFIGGIKIYTILLSICLSCISDYWMSNIFMICIWLFLGIYNTILYYSLVRKAIRKMIM